MKNRTALFSALALGCSVSAFADEPQVLVEAEVIVVEVAPIRVIEKKAEPKPVQEAKPVEEAKPLEEATTSDKPAAGDDGKKAEAQPGKDEDLRMKMLELERELQATRNKFQEKANAQKEKVRKDALKALDDINLPKDPTRKQCEAYVEALRKACEGRRSFSSSDPATLKLKEIPAEHFDLLITEMTNRTSLRYYANYAMSGIEPEKMRERFVKSIGENPNNIGIIVMHGWVEDVRPAIIEYINNADINTTPAWFQAAVELDEPAIYPKLHEITTQSKYASQFINMLEMLPDYDMAHTVDVCWRRARDGKLSINYTSFAAKAAGYGNADALGSLVDQLRANTSYMSHSSSNARRINVLRFIDYRGSNTEIQQWYKDNKDQLVFDHYRKRFHLPEDF